YLPIVKEVIGFRIPETTTLHYVERCGSGFGDRLGVTLASNTGTISMRLCYLLATGRTWAGMR
ncbi:hypothetical protein BU25DRAFT_480904, partial [Macroventuria anomochaeta]